MGRPGGDRGPRVAARDRRPGRRHGPLAAARCRPSGSRATAATVSRVQKPEDPLTQFRTIDDLEVAGPHRAGARRPQCAPGRRAGSGTTSASCPACAPSPSCAGGAPGWWCAATWAGPRARTRSTPWPRWPPAWASWAASRCAAPRMSPATAPARGGGRGRARRGGGAGEHPLRPGGDEERPGSLGRLRRPGRPLRARRLRVGAPGPLLDGRGGRAAALGGRAPAGRGDRGVRPPAASTPTGPTWWCSAGPRCPTSWG